MKKFLCVCFLFPTVGLFAQSTETEMMTYTSGENVGSCRLVFTRVTGEEITFWNPDLGAFADAGNPCMIANQYQDTPFLISFQMGSQEIISGNSGTYVIETEILTDIQLAP